MVPRIVWALLWSYLDVISNHYKTGSLPRGKGRMKGEGTYPIYDFPNPDSRCEAGEHKRPPNQLAGDVNPDSPFKFQGSNEKGTQGQNDYEREAH